MSSLAVGRGPESELYWLGGLFTAAELAAADLLLKLRGDDDEAAAASADTSSYSRRFPSSRREDLAVVDQETEEERAFEDAATASAATPFSSRRSASSCCQVPVKAEEEPRPILKETAPSLLGSMELDRRARKRYRLLSELYAATAPVTSSSASAEKIRKVHGDHGAGTVESSVDQATRNGEGLVAQKGFYVITTP
ncbi:uncharacterized protein [Triticum aestivum]|uniref:uncharacterized protein n=1 Tax=Triticum aestivum TaxID=4565 RepID=UPI001D032C1B|nr:uncharacterized protein LOC123116708 [Triticum aestivum]